MNEDKIVRDTLFFARNERDYWKGIAERAREECDRLNDIIRSMEEERDSLRAQLGAKELQVEWLRSEVRLLKGEGA